MDRLEITRWLREDSPQQLEELWERADAVRRRFVADAVHLRGLIEISNFCVRGCGYCGIRAGNTALGRYRMSEAEILRCAEQARELGYGTVVLQAGEDPGLSKDFIGGLVRRIKLTTPLTVTLSLGERADDELVAWREAGADRYLLRLETSNRRLFERIHPPLPGRVCDRIAILRRLAELGYQVGSGVMIGIPGQSYDDLANDIEMFRALDLDMIGVGPYIPHPATPLGQAAMAAMVTQNTTKSPDAADENPLGADQAPATELMTYKVVALARLACPRANIPSTTALATLNRQQGRELGLMRGANVVMPNLTPVEYRAMYEIYPAKACIYETAEQCSGCLRSRIHAIGRTIGVGPGHASPRCAVPGGT